MNSTFEINSILRHEYREMRKRWKEAFIESIGGRTYADIKRHNTKLARKAGELSLENTRLRQRVTALDNFEIQYNVMRRRLVMEQEHTRRLEAEIRMLKKLLFEKQQA